MKYSIGVYIADVGPTVMMVNCKRFGDPSTNLKLKRKQIIVTFLWCVNCVR